MYFSAPTCQRRSPILNVVLMASLVGALLLLINALCRTAHGQEIDYQRAATVQIKTPVGLGSGVCITPDGLILSAAHVIYSPGKPKLFGTDAIQMPAAVEVTFPGRKPEAARVLAVSKAGEPADLAVLQCSGSEYPSLRLAERSPTVGEDIVTMGYPAGYYCRLEGQVTFVGLSNDKTSDCITARGRPNPGHSGGPLLNAHGEIVGITSAATYDQVTVCGKLVLQDQLGFYTRVEQVHSLLTNRQIKVMPTGDRRDQGWRAKSQKRLRLKIYVQSRQRGKCRPCDVMKDDIEKGRIKIQGRTLTEVCDVTWCYADEQPNEATTAQITGFPTVVCVDTGERIEGYSTADDFLSRVSVKINIGPKEPAGPPPLFGPLPGESLPPAPTPAPVPEGEPQADTETETDPDVAGVKVIVLLKKQELGWFESAIPMIETFAKRGFASKVRSAIGDKCDVVVCLERTNPDRYSELMAITGSDQEKVVSVIVLAPQSFKGVIGVLAGKVEEVLKSLTDRDWKFANVQPVFERIEPDNYRSIVEALDETEPKADEGGKGLLAMIFASITGAIGLGESFLNHRARTA